MNVVTQISSLALIACALLFNASHVASAAIIPVGIQAGVSQTELNSWGWTEIHRSRASDNSSTGSLLSRAAGDYLMMGVWDRSLREYAILGAGETSIVTAITAGHYTQARGALNNWSNGINFYRTSSTGAWGFTSNDSIYLNTFDIVLNNGSNQYGNANDIGDPARGLSFYTHNQTAFGGSGSYNPSGVNLVYLNSTRYERVFFTASADAPATAPEPASLLIFAGLAACGGVAVWRRKRRTYLDS